MAKLQLGRIVREVKRTAISDLVERASAAALTAWSRVY